MKYIIFDSRTGLECGGSLARTWNSMEEYHKWCYTNGFAQVPQNCHHGSLFVGFGRGGFDHSHDGSESGEESTLRALLIFFMEQLQDDIYNLAYVQAQAEKNVLEDTSRASRALAYYVSVNEDKNLPLVRRTIELAISEAEHATYILSRLPLHNNVSLDNLLHCRPEYLIELKVNDGFSDTSIVHMRNAIHDYIVSRVLWEWAKLTYPKFADYWKEKYEADLATIQEEADRSNYGMTARVRPAW